MVLKPMDRCESLEKVDPTNSVLALDKLMIRGGGRGKVSRALCDAAIDAFQKDEFDSRICEGLSKSLAEEGYELAF